MLCIADYFGCLHLVCLLADHHHHHHHHHHYKASRKESHVEPLRSGASMGHRIQPVVRVSNPRNYQRRGRSLYDSHQKLPHRTFPSLTHSQSSHPQSSFGSSSRLHRDDPAEWKDAYKTDNTLVSTIKYQIKWTGDHK